MARIIDFIRNASGMVLPYENFLVSPELVSAIKDRVSNGVPLLVWISPNSVETLNPFLIAYGFEATKLAIHSDAGTDSRIVTLTRKESPDTFHPHPLLDGVNSLTIETPHAIRYTGPAIPLITLPWQRFMIVDRMTDYPVEWSSPELTCLALSPINETGGVLAISYGLIHDPYTGFTGIEWPGIAATDNEILTANILKWLAGQSSDLTLPVKAFSLVDRIERSLVDFVVARLKSELTDWWTEGIPLPIRKKCAERAEEEGNKIVKEAYLDLLDVRTILEKNWRQFETDLAAVGWVGGKAAALAWMIDLNDIRKNVMHPVRRHFVRSLVDHSTVSKLTNWWDQVQRLRLRGTEIQS